MNFHLKIFSTFPVIFCLGWISASASVGIGLWTNTNGGDFNTGSNWDFGTVPNNSQTAIFDGPPSTSPTVTFSLSHNVDRVEIHNSNASGNTVIFDMNFNFLNVNSTGPSASFVLGPDFGDDANATIKEGIVNVDFLTEIGSSGMGHLNVIDSIFFNTLDLNVGRNSTGVGLLEILEIATFNVNNDVSGNDAIIGVNSGSIGEIRVDATNESGNANFNVDGRLVVGGGGSGKLVLTGNPDSANATVDADLIVGFSSGGSGTIELYDNTSLQIGGDLQVGLAGQGTVDIFGGGSSGGVITADDVFVGTIGPSGPTNQVNIHYDGTLQANSVTVGTNGVIEMFTAGGTQSELNALFDVTNYGIIKGAGKILTDQETFYNFGTIAPETTWPLDIENSLVFESGSIYEVDILDAIDWSELNVDGNLSFSSGSLEIDLLGGTLPQLGDIFEVLTWTGTLTGQFGSVDDEFGFDDGNLFFTPIYNANSLNLVVVPEPSTWALMGIGCLFIFLRFQRRG